MVFEKPLPLFSGVFNFQVDRSKFSEGGAFGSNPLIFSSAAACVIVKSLEILPPDIVTNPVRLLNAGFEATEMPTEPLLVQLDGEIVIQFVASLTVQFTLDVTVTNCVSSFAEKPEIIDTSKLSIITSSSLESLELQLNRTVKTKSVKTIFNNFMCLFLLFLLIISVSLFISLIEEQIMK
jgi:hypothetical protein